MWWTHIAQTPFGCLGLQESFVLNRFFAHCLATGSNVNFEYCNRTDTVLAQMHQGDNKGLFYDRMRQRKKFTFYYRLEIPTKTQHSHDKSIHTNF